jgi:hypothetical protein
MISGFSLKYTTAIFIVMALQCSIGLTKKEN